MKKAYIFVVALAALLLVSGIASAGLFDIFKTKQQAALPPKSEPPTTISSVLARLNACTIEVVGDHDHFVSPATFPDDGSGVCNTICKNMDKVCIAAYAMGLSQSMHENGEYDRDLATLPKLCKGNRDEYNMEVDALAGFNPMAVCNCC